MNAKNERRLRDVGLLLLRFGLGGMFVVAFGWAKIKGGPKTWHGLGQAMGVLGITFWPTLWGFCAAVAEFFGGICVITGLLFRPACVLITFTMLVAAISQSSLAKAQNAIEFGIVTFALLLIGPGSWALDRYVRWHKPKP
ncbi:MAG TPA: DoxX family protein [Planctomycetota bacterium]|nr:DoxX family protein [Planctomycetota bacterium]